MNEEGKFLKKLWFCVGVWGGGGREGVVLHDSFFINWFYKVNMQKKMTLRHWWEHSNVKNRNYKRIVRG